MIHKYSLNGYNIVMDTNSGAVHIFDEAPFEMLNYLDESVPENPPQELLDGLKGKYDEDTVRSAYSELTELYQKGQLFSSDDY